MIVVSDLSVAFGGTPALRRVTLNVAQGEIVLLGGASGCGKSTLLRAMAGIIPHVVPAGMTGDVWIGGRRTVDMPPVALAGRIGLVFQNPSAQLFNLTVGEEVAFGPHNLGLPGAAVEERAAWALEAAGLGGRAGRDVRTLSGGERQRLAIAAVLAMRPSVLALDEPMASLDVDGTRRLVDVMTGLNRSAGTTVVIAEHRLREAALAAGRTILLDEGRVAADGGTARILGDRTLLRRLGLRRPAVEPQTAWESLIRPGHPPAGEVVVGLEGVDASYGGEPVLRDVTLTLCEGECVALVGDNGSGKSTIARLLAGFMKPDRGACRWRRGAPQPGLDVGILLQDPREQLFTESVGDEVAFGPRNAGRDDGPAVDALIVAADLQALRGRTLHSLSHGQLHRTALASVLALQPRLLILDEPTVGQDWRHLSLLMDAVQQLRAAGSAVLLISHDFKLIHRQAGRIVLLRHGRVAMEGVPLDPPPEGE